jgi:hypothetical protein
MSLKIKTGLGFFLETKTRPSRSQFFENNTRLSRISSQLSEKSRGRLHFPQQPLERLVSSCRGVGSQMWRLPNQNLRADAFQKDCLALTEPWLCKNFVV